MEKCLITKLNGVVDNDSLKKFGEIDIPILTGESIQINSTHFTEPPTVWLKSGNVTCFVGGTTVTLPHVLSTGTITITAVSDSVVAYREVYKQATLGLSNTNDWDIDTEEFKYAPLTYASVQNSLKFHGDIKNIYKKGNIQTNVTIGNNQLSDNVYGDISSLGVCTAVTSITVRYQSGVGGSIESLVAAFRANERTTDSITMTTNSTMFTFNGSSVTAGSHTLAWTASTITWDGTTITA